MNRKEWLKSAGLLAGAVVLSGSTSVNTSEQKSKKVLRIGHMTDPHIRPENDSEKWVRKCIRTIQELSEAPDFIFNGGDSIGDALNKDEQTVKNQWDLWNKISKDEFKIPVYHCIGNHDVWGIKEAKNDARYAKQWAINELGMKERYYRFEKSGWHFIVLDSTHIREDGSWYIAKLDEQQFSWLEQQLKEIPSNEPIFITSHIPILCAAAYFDGENEKKGDWQVPGRWMHIDARKIVELFYKHPNVKLCISGHIHLKDAVVYNDVTYYCNGAVSGNWWKGNYQQTPPGFALIDLFEDGRFEHQYVTYGWEK